MKSVLLSLLESYLLFLAKTILAIYRPVIIGITGSVGKTTTRQAIYHVMTSAGLPVRQTEGNLNAELGIALTVLDFDHAPAIWEWPLLLLLATLNWLLTLIYLKPFPRYLVVELGIDRLGDMERLLKLLKPTVGVVTWIGEGHHLEFLKDPETIASEKGKLLAALPTDGLAIIAAADPLAARLEKMARAPVRKVKTLGIDTALAMAEIVADYIGVDQQVVAKAWKTFKRPKGRLQQFAGINGSVVIDDSYNASLPSVKLALDMLNKTSGKRKIAVLGDILEQGEKEREFHQQVEQLAKAKADLFIAVGRRMKELNSDSWYASPDDAVAALPGQIQAGDVILVKGSQGMRMEKISLALAEDKKEAASHLPRQSLRWRQIPFTNP